MYIIDIPVKHTSKLNLLLNSPLKARKLLQKQDSRWVVILKKFRMYNQIVPHPMLNCFSYYILHHTFDELRGSLADFIDMTCQTSTIIEKSNLTSQQFLSLSNLSLNAEVRYSFFSLAGIAGFPAYSVTNKLFRRDKMR